MKRVQKGHVTLKWYVVQMRALLISACSTLHERKADVFVVGTWEASPDSGRCGSGIAEASMRSYSADKEALPVAKEELHILLEKPAMEGIPLLVLGNKSDLPDHGSVDELIDALNLKAVTHREVSCYGISAKEETNLDAVLQWLIARATK
ncbi:hypothetical protein LTR12_017784 [Friedmanniomyces endolithicus]|nr:hypothetical protein LTR12_017784 [Friedmanniomyces endolithicus]